MLPPDHHLTHPESGTERSLYECPALRLTATGQPCRVMIATHPASMQAPAVGTTREGVVYELFFTALPPEAFTASEVVELSLHRGAFETVLADEDQEQDPDRWCSHPPCGQEFWHILSQWVWHLRWERGQHLHPTPMRTTEFAQANPDAQEVARDPAPELSGQGSPEVVHTARMGCLPGSDFPLQTDGTLRCPAGYPLSPQERRLERDGTLRVVDAARIGHCRPCPRRECCQGYGASTKKPRRLSAILRPTALPERCQEARTAQIGTAPLLWGDWKRCQRRREWMRLLRSQRVDILVDSPPRAAPAIAPRPLSRPQRAHWRLSWAERLTRNARSPAAPGVHFTVFGVPPAFATCLGLPTI